LIYLDNSATTSLAPEVREAIEPWLTNEYGNASSVHAIGRSAKVALEDAREVIANAIGARISELVFTSSGTEANNAAIIGRVMHRKFKGAEFASQSVITTNAEHHAVLEPIDFLCKLGVKIKCLSVDQDGRISADTIAAYLDASTSIVSTMLVNNETGSINPVTKIAGMVHSRSRALMHTDAAQALGKLPLNVYELGVDLASFSAHKLHGPKGIGALFVKEGTELEPLIHGGAQERNRRGGTESVALAVGFAEAVRLSQTRLEHDYVRMESLGHWFRSELLMISGVMINSPEHDWQSSIINLSFAPELLNELDGETLIMRFDLEGIAVSNGAACTSGTVQPSHVLLAMGKGPKIAGASVRVSMSHETTKEALDQFLVVLRTIINR
jgi:cysteine desulfurase